MKLPVMPATMALVDAVTGRVAPMFQRWWNVDLALLVNPGALPDYADDAAAAAGGVPVGGRYRNGSVLMVRVA